MSFLPFRSMKRRHLTDMGDAICVAAVWRETGEGRVGHDWALDGHGIRHCVDALVSRRVVAITCKRFLAVVVIDGFSLVGRHAVEVI